MTECPLCGLPIGDYGCEECGITLEQIDDIMEADGE